MAGTFPASTVHHLGPRLRFAKRVRSSIDGICQNAANRDVTWKFPDDRGRTTSHRRHAHLFFAKPDQHLAHAPQFGHFAKHQVKRLLDALIRILLDATVPGPRETDWNWNP